MRIILFRKFSLTKNRFCLHLTFKLTCILITNYILLLYAYINTFFFRAGVESIKRDKILQYGAIGSNVERSRNHWAVMYNFGTRTLSRFHIFGRRHWHDSILEHGRFLIMNTDNYYVNVVVYLFWLKIIFEKTFNDK